MISRGFTLVEWLVAMLLGLFLLAGVFTVFVMSRSSSEDAFDQSELQENGRLAIRLIANSTSKCDTRLCRLTVLFEYLDRLPESETFPRS